MTADSSSEVVSVDVFLHRLAARAALLVIPSSQHQALVERLSEYVQDRGAIGLLIRDYEQTERIEKTALYYWNSRLERTGSRFEDIVSTIIISIFSSVIAGVIVEMWKGEFGPLKRLLTDVDKDRLRILARKEPQLRRDLEAVLPFYYKKLSGGGVQDRSIAQSLYESLSAGSSFNAYGASNADAVAQGARTDLLRYAQAASRGLLETEMRRAQTNFVLPQQMNISGKSYSEHLAFGEVINLSNDENFGLGHNWRGELSSRLNVPRLYPELWPEGNTFYETSPKIVILDNNIFEDIYRSNHKELFVKCAGIITSPTAGMTSHVAITCRSLGIGGIGCTLPQERRMSAKFALFQSGRLTLYDNRPNLTEREITHLLAAMNRFKHS